jgi:hypothetical protein
MLLVFAAADRTAPFVAAPGGIDAEWESSFCRSFKLVNAGDTAAETQTSCESGGVKYKSRQWAI